jgi:hypothetical protein
MSNSSDHSSAAASDNDAVAVNHGRDEEGRIAFSDQAPLVDLELLVLENNGLRVISHPEMGRVAVATRSFDRLSLETVLREKPALICKANDYLDFMEQFLECPEESQVGILDMFYQPLSSPMGKSLMEPAQILYMLGALADVHVIHQLLSIYATNAHQYQDDKSAMPILGSKISHSCQPNLAYSSEYYDDGSISYHAIRPIQQGDILSFSYLSDLSETPTPERRQLLQSTKSFFCQCERCCGPDYCRVLKCPKCKAYLPCSYISSSNPNDDDVVHSSSIDNHLEPVWECNECGILPNQLFFQMETLLEKAVSVMEKSFEMKLSFSQRPDYSIEAVQDLAKSCAQQLSPTHHLTVKALRLLAQISTTYAYNYSKRMVVRGLSIDNPQIHSYFQSSVLSTLRLVAACECVAAGCPGCGPLVPSSIGSKPTFVQTVSFAHDALYDCVTPMRHFCDNLLQLPVTYWPSFTISFVERYLPLLKLKFGSKANEFERSIVLKWKDAICLECGTFWDASKGD